MKEILEDDLQVCPGCGKNDDLSIAYRARSADDGTRVVCERCGWQGPNRQTREDAVDAWNTRPSGESK